MAITPERAAEPTDAPALDHVVVYSSDPAAGRAFYRCLLGLLGFVERRPGTFARAGLVFDVRAADAARPPRRRGEPGIDHVGFAAGSRAQVDRIDAAVQAAGIAARRIVEFDDGAYALFVTDPDGLRIELTCYPAGAAAVD